MPRPALCAAALAGLLAGLVAGCGGGVWLGIGDDGDARPDVDLVASPDAARAGETVTLVAAASDDFGVDRVEFFRIEDDGRALLLAGDRTRPYQLDTALPDTAAASVRYFARAVDDAEQHRDSATVRVDVLR